MLISFGLVLESAEIKHFHKEQLAQLKVCLKNELETPYAFLWVVSNHSGEESINALLILCSNEEFNKND